MSACARLNALSTVVSFGLLLALPGPSNAQPMFKCLKGTAVTYSNTSCEQLGLKPAGQVRDRVTTLPMGGSAQAKGPAGAGAKQPQSSIAKENQIDMPPTSSIKPVNPLIEKLAK